MAWKRDTPFILLIPASRSCSLLWNTLGRPYWNELARQDFGEHSQKVKVYSPCRRLLRFCLRERLSLFRRPNGDCQPLHRTIPRCDSTSQEGIEPRRDPAAWPNLDALENKTWRTVLNTTAFEPKSRTSLE